MTQTLQTIGRAIIDRLSADRQINAMAQRVQKLADEVHALEVHRDELYDRLAGERRASDAIDRQIEELQAWVIERRASAE